MPIVKTLLKPLTKGEIPQSKRHSPGRYEKSWAYQDDEERYFIGTFTPESIPPHSTDTVYVLEAGDLARPDLLAYKFYKIPAYYWIILWLNGINDPFEQMYTGMALRIPTLRRLAEYGVKA